jgi:hypothetical protein
MCENEVKIPDEGSAFYEDNNIDAQRRIEQSKRQIASIRPINSNAPVGGQQKSSS